MFTDFINTQILKIKNAIAQGAASRMTDLEFLEKEIECWKASPQRLMQIKGHLYYDGDHDIMYRKRTMIGDDGKLQVVDNLPNNLVIDNQYAIMVNQKANYLFGKPIVVDGENKQYAETLTKIFDEKFMKILKDGGKASYNSGIAWLYPHYDVNGDFTFRMFPGYEVLPFWKDSEHTELDFAVRLYLVTGYEGREPVIIEKVEVYDLKGIHRYVLDNGRLIPDIIGDQATEAAHVTVMGDDRVSGFNWEKVPLIALKSNETEIPLLKKTKSLQDGINAMLSDFENNMQEDSRNTIIVIHNYDGEELGRFRRNLATYGVIKVRTDSDAKGGVETLQITVNAENYKIIIEEFRKALIKNAMGYDGKDDRLSGNPNQMNIMSMYSDIDISANDTETEYQAAFKNILWFVNAHLANTGQGEFGNEDMKIIFNRDILMNEAEIISNCRDSLGLLSDETVISNHPWVDDVEKELERLKKQKDEEMKQMAAEAESGYAPFGKRTAGSIDDGQGTDGKGPVGETG